MRDEVNLRGADSGKSHLSPTTIYGHFIERCKQNYVVGRSIVALVETDSAFRVRECIVKCASYVASQVGEVGSHRLDLVCNRAAAEDDAPSDNKGRALFSVKQEEASLDAAAVVTESPGTPA